MTRWPLRYHFLQRDELEGELFELCLRLRRSRRESNCLSAAGDAVAAGHRLISDDRAARRCYLSSRACSDFDFPQLLEADEQIVALLRTLNEAASLLYFFAKSKRNGPHSDRYSPS